MRFESGELFKSNWSLTGKTECFNQYISSDFNEFCSDFCPFFLTYEFRNFGEKFNFPTTPLLKNL